MELLAGLVLSLTAAVVGAWQIARRDRPLHGPVDDGTLGLPRIQRWNESYHPPRLQRLRSRFPRFELSRFVLALLVLLVVLGGAIAVYTRSASESASRHERFTAGITRIDQRITDARAAGDVATAYAMLIDARAELAELGSLATDDASRQQVAAHQAAIESSLADLAVAAPVEGTHVVGGYPAAPSGITPQVVTAGGRVFLLADAVYEVDPINAVLVQLLKPGDVVGEVQALQPRAITWRDDRLLAVDAKRAYALDPATGIWQALPLATFDTAGHVDATAAETYDGNLYLFSPAGGTILKFQAEAYSASPEDWVGNVAREEMASAVDFAIDGHVYVLLEDGRILDFLRSRLEATFTPAVVPPLSRATAIVAEPEQRFIYVLHGPDGRILRLTRDGALAQQITMGDAAGRLRDAIGLAVDEEKNLAFVLTQTSVVTVRLPAPPAADAEATPAREAVQ